IDRCTISNMAGDGILVSAVSPLQVTISNSAVLASNRGVEVVGSAGKTAVVTISYTRVEQSNHEGIATFAPARVHVADSIVTGSSRGGAFPAISARGGDLTLTVDATQVVANGSLGLLFSGVGSGELHVTVSRSTIAHNVGDGVSTESTAPVANVDV